MAQALADITLKTNQFGSTVRLRNVTPAEVMFLVADNHSQAGGDPILKLDELPEDHETSQLKPLAKQLSALNEQGNALDNEPNITPEVRQGRMQKLSAERQRLLDKIAALENIRMLRQLGPAAERRRLGSKYMTKRVNGFFPGGMPTLPQTFEEARTAGIELTAPSERLLTVGDNS